MGFKYGQLSTSLHKAQLKVIHSLMEFPAKVRSVYCCPANNHQPLYHSWLQASSRGNQNYLAQWGNMGIRGTDRKWCVGGSAKGLLRERKKRKVGGHSRGLGRGIYQQIE